MVHYNKGRGSKPPPWMNNEEEGDQDPLNTRVIGNRVYEIVGRYMFTQFYDFTLYLHLLSLGPFNNIIFMIFNYFIYFCKQ